MGVTLILQCPLPDLSEPSQRAGWGARGQHTAENFLGRTACGATPKSVTSGARLSGKCEEGNKPIIRCQVASNMPRLHVCLSSTCRNIFPPLVLAGVPLFAHIALQGRLQRLVRSLLAARSAAS